MVLQIVENEKDEIENYKIWGGMNGEALSLTCATASFFAGWCIALVMDWALHKFMEIRNDEMLPEDNEADQLCTVSHPYDIIISMTHEITHEITIYLGTSSTNKVMR